MENFLSRPYVEEDQTQVLDLLLDYRLATTVQAYPTLWRLLLLLSSRVWEPARDVRVWENESGRLIGLAMLWRRQREHAHLTLEHLIHVEWARQDLVNSILRWSVRRAREVATENTRPLRLVAAELKLPIYSKMDFTTHGFSPIAVDPQSHGVFLTRSLEESIPEPQPPADYTIRPLAGMGELERYRELYDFTAVNVEHQHKTVESEEYNHLVAVSPAGEFVAHCEHSIHRTEWKAGAERVGWIDYIGTHEDERRKGLGEALLLTALHNLRSWGADTATLATMSNNVPAVALYHKVGFAALEGTEPRRYEAQISPECDRSDADQSG